MKSIFTFFAIALPFISFSQTDKPMSNVDSARYYQKEYSRLLKETMDSIQKSEPVITLENNIIRLRKRTNSYSAGVFFGELMHSDFTTINNSIAQDGFENMSPYSFRFGFGYSKKHARIMLDAWYATAGLNHRSKKGDEAILSSLSNLLQFDLGYDVVNSSAISVYPYGGLSLRMASLSYTNSGQLNPGYTNITNISQNSQSIMSTSFRAGYHAGLGLDVVIANAKNNKSSLILFTKAGINRPFGTDIFRIHGERYNPGIRHGEWLISFGVKFAGRVNY